MLFRSSDPGRHLIRGAIDAGVRVEPVPGASAVIAAVAGSGLGDGRFLFLGFPPTKSKQLDKWAYNLKHRPVSVVFFEAPHRIRKTLLRLEAVLGDIEIVVARELTKVHECFVRGPISAALSDEFIEVGELTVVISPSSEQLELPADPPTDAEMAIEFCQITENVATSRRDAIRALAKKYSISQNDVYKAVERWKSYVK